MDEAEEAAVEEQLRSLRQQIAAAKHMGAEPALSPGWQPGLGRRAWRQHPGSCVTAALQSSKAWMPP